jgi:uncharacterized protein DUF4136
MRRVAMMAVLAVSLAAAQGARAQKVTMEFDQDADFSQFKTFTMKESHLNSKDPALNSDLVKQQIDDDIEQALTAKGLLEVPKGADLNVMYRLGAAKKTQVETYPTGWWGMGTRVVRVPYAEGTLVIDLRDAQRHALVWRAVSSVEKSDPSKIQGKLNDMVKKSFDKFPPKKK